MDRPRRVPQRVPLGPRPHNPAAQDAHMDAHSATGTGWMCACVTGDGASKLVTGHWSASQRCVTDMNWELECQPEVCHWELECQPKRCHWSKTGTGVPGKIPPVPLFISGITKKRPCFVPGTATIAEATTVGEVGSGRAAVAVGGGCQDALRRTLQSAQEQQAFGRGAAATRGALLPSPQPAQVHRCALRRHQEAQQGAVPRLQRFTVR